MANEITENVGKVNNILTRSTGTVHTYVSRHVRIRIRIRKIKIKIICSMAECQPFLKI